MIFCISNALTYFGAGSHGGFQRGSTEGEGFVAKLPDIFMEAKKGNSYLKSKQQKTCQTDPKNEMTKHMQKLPDKQHATKNLQLWHEPKHKTKSMHLLNPNKHATSISNKHARSGLGRQINRYIDTQTQIERQIEGWMDGWMGRCINYRNPCFLSSWGHQFRSTKKYMIKPSERKKKQKKKHAKSLSQPSGLRTVG